MSSGTGGSRGQTPGSNLQLKLSLSILLDTWDIPDIVRPVGPLFHRWLPDGQNDALCLTAAEEKNQILVWFDRRAVKRNDFLVWDRDGKDFDIDLMRRQGRLDAGYLRGEVLFREISDQELAAVTRTRVAPGEPFGQGVVEDPDYVAFAKRLAKFLQPPLARFVDTMRTQYGQYWLNTVLAWDARKQTLGSYCSVLGLCWWDESESRRYRLLPTDSGTTIHLGRLPGRGFGEYLTEVDWRRLQETRCREAPSLELVVIGQASRYLDQGEYRAAFVEGISALELAVSRYFDSVPVQPRTHAALQALTDRASFNSLAAAVLQLRGIGSDDIETVLEAIHKRNRIVHEGASASSGDAELLRSTLRITATLLDVPELKTPCLSSGNSLAAPNGATVVSGAD